jgi:glycosyltransferase involved in cell wall biosynthesis
MKFSLVIPCYNEAANLPLLLDRCDRLVAIGDVEVVLVDNGSTDDSAAVLARLLPDHPGCRSIRVDRNQGYGFGILAGLAAARGEILGWTHADLQTDPFDAAAGLRLFEGGPHNVFVKGRRHGRPFGDVVFTFCMSVFETLLLRKPFWDINAQPTLFRRELFESWSDAPSGFALDLFAYFQARRSGAVVRRFPVLFGARAHGVSHWNVNWAAKRKFIQRTVEFSLQLRRSFTK